MLNLRQKQATYSNTRSGDDAVHQYIDVDVVNNRFAPSYTDNTNQYPTPMGPQPLIFNQIKLQNIVDNCSDYYLSVIRWSMDSIIPIIIPQIEVYSPPTPTVGDDGIRTVYGVSFSYGVLPNSTDAYQVGTATPVLFTPDDLTLTRPVNYPRTQEEIYGNPYYYIRTVQSFLDMVNRSIKTAWDAVVVTSPAEKPDGPAPKFVWNAIDGKIEYLVPNHFVYVEGQPNYFLNVNTALYNLLDTFTFKYVNQTSASEVNFNAYSLFLYDQHQRFEYGFDLDNTSIEMFIYTQDSSSVPSWTPCTSIQFTTATIPVNPSATSAPLYLGQNLKSALAASAQSNIITDFQIPLTIGTELTGQLYYAPTSEYRLFDLVTNGALQQLNIEVSWLDKLGNGHQFLLKSGGTASLKIMLRKKAF
jgi:hypothetical protein